jgi:hypothetical protein
VLKTVITNSVGNKSSAKVNGDNALYTIDIPYPPLEVQKVKPFRQYLTDDGTASGSNDLGIDGSVTNVCFYVQASNDSDRYIKSLSIIVGYSATSKPYLFADAAALTNGCRLYYESFRGEVDIDDAIKTNAELLRIANDNIVLSDWQIRHLAANNDYGYLVKIDLTEFSPTYGIKLDKGTDQRLIMCIRDDATAADDFNIQAVGFDRFE